MSKGHALGPVCVTTCFQGKEATLIDGAWTKVEKWGDDTHGAVAIRLPWTARALVVALRGSRIPRERVLHPLKQRRRIIGNATPTEGDGYGRSAD